MLDLKAFVTAGALAFLGWAAISISDLKTNTEVIAVKVGQNHEMLSVLWDDFLKDRTNGNLAWLDEQTDLHSTIEKE